MPAPHHPSLPPRLTSPQVTANALYGFTGAQTSPLQCVPMADSCLAYGAAACRRALQVLEAAAASGEVSALMRVRTRSSARAPPQAAARVFTSLASLADRDPHLLLVQLGPHGAGARVVYGHTDSLFCHLPAAAGPAEAMEAGRAAARAVSASFPPPMELKFERACQPLLLLHVNRWVGARVCCLGRLLVGRR